ncbi:MAG: class I adenylate-forming enzyme family protein [Alphaproteobacteria bacterium]|nr:class I adenylate-forming enzyme family protein [Alphaproteobacteria bacterium]
MVPVNIADSISTHALTRPDHPAIEDGDRVITYAELEAAVNSFVATLGEAHVGQGDFVGVKLPDSADHIVVLLALARLGACVIPFHGSSTELERKEAIAGFGVKAVIAPMGESPIPGLATIPLQHFLEGVGSGAETSPSVLRDPYPESHPVIVVQSSGTTGRPKRMLISHEQVAARFRSHRQLFDLTPSERYLSVINCCFFAGSRRCLMILDLGGTVILNSARTVDELYSALAKREITFTNLTPAHLRQCLSVTPPHEPVAPDLKLGITSSVITAEERRRARQRLTPNVFETYGSNEVGVIASARPDDHRAHPETVGRVSDSLDVQIVDEHDEPLPPGGVGHIRCRGPDLIRGYHDNPEDTARNFRNGWFYPGDLGMMDDEGFLFFKGRADDVINNEGAKFYPVEVENALHAHPAVTEAAVFGWPHPQHGEVAVAFVVTTEKITGAELAEFCRPHIASYKVPYRIAFVDAMPRNPMGKILKTRLKEMLRQELAGKPS